MYCTNGVIYCKATGAYLIGCPPVKVHLYSKESGVKLMRGVDLGSYDGYVSPMCPL